MISQSYLRVMSRYNRWQNQALFKAAGYLSDDERTRDRGAFWGSVHGTLSHIYWADRIWLSRFDITEPPSVSLADSARYVQDFSQLMTERDELDQKVIHWSDEWQVGPIKGELEWFSGSIQRNAKAPLSVVLVHFFNHQTHHRGQAHALITAAGGATEDTDLFLMPKEHWPPQEGR